MANKKRKVYKKKTKKTNNDTANKNKNNVTTNTNANAKKRTTKKSTTTNKKTTSIKKQENINKSVEVTEKVVEEKKEQILKESNDVIKENESNRQEKQTSKKNLEKQVKKSTKSRPKQEEKAVEEKPKQEEKVVEEKPKQEEKVVEEKPKQEKKVVEEKPKQEKRIPALSFIDVVKSLIFKNRIIFYATLILLFFIIFFGILIIKDKKNDVEVIKFETINFKKYLNLYEENHDLEYVYITNNSCLKCNDYEVSLKKIENDFKIKIKELNITNFSDKELKDLEENNSFIVDIRNIPFLVSIKDKKIVSVIIGIKEYSAVKNFVTYSNNPTNKSFDKISIDKYLSLLNSKDSILIYIGTSSDSACEKFSTILEKVSSSKGIKVHYLNTDDIVTDDGIKKLNESNEIFSKQWFVPTILIVKNGSIKDYRMYAMSEEELIRFLDKNKM